MQRACKCFQRNEIEGSKMDWNGGPERRTGAGLRSGSETIPGGGRGGVHFLPE